jgi:uncharacterized membrane protein YkvA (DUF1232 family)
MWKRVAMLWTLVRTDARLLWAALQHPLSPRWLKPAVVLMVVYVVSPVDFIPDFVPFLGVVDDIVLVPLAVRFVLRRLPAVVRADIGARG